MHKLDRIDPVLLSTNRRASYDSWLKYEPIVLAAFRQHPRTYVYKPTSMAASSVCSKIRDAIRGAIAFPQYLEGKEVTSAVLASWYSSVIFKHDKEHVYIGTPETVRATLQGESKNNAVTFSFPTLSFEEVSAFALLLSGGRLVGPVHIASPPDLSLLPARPNVELMEREDGSLILL